MSPNAPVGVGEPFWRRAARLLYGVYTSVFQLLELSLYKLAGKKMFVTYQGDDARQGEYSRANFQINIASQVDHSYYNPGSDRHKQRMIRRLDKYCEQIYAVNPDLLHVLPARAKFVPYSHLFIEEWTPSYSQTEARPLKFFHAPSHRKVKGTDLILKTLEELKAEGAKFDFLLVEGMSNAEALEAYRSADILIDQLYAGWYGGLAVEAMALGKPVLVYLREDDFRYLDPQMVKDFPFFNVNPETLKDGLRKVLAMPREELLEVAKKSRRYVERWHDPLKIAQQIKADYEEALSDGR